MSYRNDALDKAYSALPELPDLQARWLGPLVDGGFAEWISDLSEGAYGYLEDCGWNAAVDGMGEMLDGDGAVTAAWLAALNDAAGLLAEAGTYAGPESDAERWRSWLVWELAAPHQWARRRVDEST